VGGPAGAMMGAQLGGRATAPIREIIDPAKGGQQGMNQYAAYGAQQPSAPQGDQSSQMDAALQAAILKMLSEQEAGA